MPCLTRGKFYAVLFILIFYIQPFRLTSLNLELSETHRDFSETNIREFPRLHF